MDLLPVARALHIGAMVLLGGVSAFRLLLLPRDVDGASLARVLRAVGACAGATAVVSWAAWLAAVAIAMSGLPAVEALTPEVLRTVATQTNFGRVWLWRGVLLLVLAALQWRPAHAGPRGLDAVAALLAVCALGSMAASGHALGAHAEHLVVDAVHLLSAGLWLGMLPLLWWIIDRAVTTGALDDERLAVLVTQRFALPGVTAVISLALTGALNAWWLVGSPANLLTSRYGLLVLLKIGLYLGMVLLALLNRLVLSPRLAGRKAGALRALRRTVMAETVLGVLVLAVVAVLGVTPPAAREHSGHPMHEGMWRSGDLDSGRIAPADALLLRAEGGRPSRPLLAGSRRLHHISVPVDRS